MPLAERRLRAPPDPLETAADHALAARAAIDRTSRPRLRRLVDLLLLEYSP
ncbi:hypothetical protein [uncultured Methylobacterium sp.]|uniref:hypothetical protein n=1 Tax=uncultured Methylobacterium sp. TaxID=157278 RepID=UPI0035CB14A0